MEKHRACLVRMIYQGETSDQQFDEIRILENDRTVFHGCAQHGGPLIFKSKAVDDQSSRKLQFFVNDQPADECLFRTAPAEDRPKQRHGPPQLLDMLSVVEDSPSTPIRVNPFRPTTDTDPELLSQMEEFIQLSASRLTSMFNQSNHQPSVSSIVPDRERGDVELFNLIYLHSSAPSESVVEQLRASINRLKIFDDADDCLASLNNIENRKLILIVSEPFARSFLPRLESLRTLVSIYILNEEDSIGHWTENHKVRGVFSAVDEIAALISEEIGILQLDVLDIQEVYHNRDSIRFPFLYRHFLAEILHDRRGTDNAFDELIHFVRNEYRGNREELENIELFRTTYRKDQAINWFLKRCFLSKILSLGLLLMDASLLFPLRSFLHDLHDQVELHSVSESVTIYVAETVERASLDCVEQIRLAGNTISWSQYLLGSSDQRRAIDQAKQLSLRNDHSIPLLIRLEIPANGKCLARLANVENGFDLLLQSDLIWTIVGVENDFQRSQGVALLHLTFVSPEDQVELQEKIEEKREDIDDVSPLVQLTRLMICNQICFTAEQFIERLFDDDDERWTGDVHRQESLAKSFKLLGLDQLRNENPTRAQALFRLSLDASLRLTQPKPVELYSIYIYLAETSLSQEDHHSAEEFYAKALDVQRSSNIADLYAMAHCYDQLGKIYLQDDRKSDALEAFTFTLDILEQTSETTEEDLLAIFTSLAHTYMSQKEYPQAILYYNKAIQVEEDAVEPDRQQVALFHRLIADMFKEMNQYEQALHHYQTTLRYCLEYIPAGDPVWIHIYVEIGQMYLQMNEYFDALNSFFQGLLMASSFDREDEPPLGKLLHGVALLFVELGRFEQAKELVEKSTQRYQRTYPVDFQQVQTNRSLMAIIEEKQSDQEITRF